MICLIVFQSFGAVLLRLRVSFSVWILIHIAFAPRARLVVPAVGAAYLVKCSNIALQAAQMGVIRYILIYPYICPNGVK